MAEDNPVAGFLEIAFYPDNDITAAALKAIDDIGPPANNIAEPRLIVQANNFGSRA